MPYTDFLFVPLLYLHTCTCTYCLYTLWRFTLIIIIPKTASASAATCMAHLYILLVTRSVDSVLVNSGHYHVIAGPRTDGVCSLISTYRYHHHGM